MKQLLLIATIVLLSVQAKAQDFTLRIKNYIVTYNASNTQYKYNDTGIYLYLKPVAQDDSSVVMYQEIRNRKREVVNKPSNIEMPKIALQLLFAYTLNLSAINTYLATFGIEAILNED